MAAAMALVMALAIGGQTIAFWLIGNQTIALWPIGSRTIALFGLGELFPRLVTGYLCLVNIMAAFYP